MGLETFRRFGQPDQWVNMIDDYVAGNFLIISGIRFRRNPVKNIRLLTVAWALLIGGLYYSIAGSVETVRHVAVETTGKSSVGVLVVKMVLMLIVLVNLICCLRWKDNTAL